MEKPNMRSPKQVFLIIAGLLILAAIVNFRSNTPSNTAAAHPTPSISQPITDTPYPTNASRKEQTILLEQKAKSEAVTKEAVQLTNAGNYNALYTLYDDRWKELNALRAAVLYDNDLTASQKGNIDNALKGEQESITAILDKLQSVSP